MIWRIKHCTFLSLAYIYLDHSDIFRKPAGSSITTPQSRAMPLFYNSEVLSLTEESDRYSLSSPATGTSTPITLRADTPASETGSRATATSQGAPVSVSDEALAKGEHALKKGNKRPPSGTTRDVVVEMCMRRGIATDAKVSVLWDRLKDWVRISFLKQCC